MGAPAQLGRYEVLEPIGQGAMGAVYKARDPALDRTVAVKTVGRTLLAFPEHLDEYLERFRREARAAGRLSHPNIVSVYDLGVDEATTTPFIVMEYVPGVSLATVLKENPLLPMDQALDIVEQIASALDEAHRNGIVHRDIKPGNVFLDTRGRVKVGDFGIARMEDSELTQTVGLGTPGYVAPEVLQGAKADARADVFSLGVVAYQLLTARKAFEGDTRDTIALKVLQHVPEPPHRVRPEVSRAVSEAVVHALAKQPSQRCSSAAAFLDELRRARGHAAATVSPATATAMAAPPPPGRARRALVAVGLLLALALLVAGGILAARQWTPRGVAAPPPSTLTARPAPTPAARPPAPATRARSSPRPTAAPATLPPAVDVLRDIVRDVVERKEDEKKKGDEPPKKGKGRRKKER